LGKRKATPANAVDLKGLHVKKGRNVRDKKRKRKRKGERKEKKAARE